MSDFIGAVLSDTELQLYEIAQGLQYLHSRGIVHGDLRGVRRFPRFICAWLILNTDQYSYHQGLACMLS